MTTKIEYIVQMTFYQYNTGSANNGLRTRGRTFKTEEEMWDFYADVRLMILRKNFPDRWAWDYVDEGYLETLDGCFKRVTETIPLTDLVLDSGEF